MGACFHIAGVSCDNCRTALNLGPWFDPGTGRWMSPVVSEVTIPAPAPAPYERMEATLEELRDEVRALAALVQRFMETS